MNKKIKALIFPTDDPKQALRFSRFLMAFSAYFICVFLCYFAYIAGFVTREAFFGWFATAVSINIILYILFRTGLNLKMADPSLTILQMCSAILMVMYLMIFANETRGVFLLIYVIILLFGIFRLNTRSFLNVSIFTLLTYGFVIVQLHLFRPQGVNFNMEYLQWAVLAGVVILFSVVGGHISGLREKISKDSSTIQRLTDNVQDVIFVLDMNLNYIYVSPSVKILRGYEPEEVFKQTPFDSMAPSSMELAKKAISEVMEFGKLEDHVAASRTLQLEIIRKDGTTVWTETRFSFIRNKDQRKQSIIGVMRDITDRRKAEAELQKREEQYRAFVESASDVVFKTDWTGHFTYANPATFTATGYPSEELIGKHYRLLIRPDMYPEVMKVLVGQYQSRVKNAYCEFPIVRKDGSEAWIGQNTQLIMDGDQVVGFQALSRDITERKKVEEALRQSEEKYRNILEGIDEGYYEIDLAGNLTFFNDSLCRIIGYPKEELLGMNYQQYEYKDTIKNVFQKYNEVFKTGKPVEFFDRQITRKDGTTRFVETSILLRKDPSGVPIGFRGIARDVTEHRQMEAELQKREEQYRAFVESASDVVFKTDWTGHFTYANPAMFNVTGYTPEELIGKHYRLLIRPDMYPEVMKVVVGQYQSREKNAYYECALVRKDGGEAWIGQNLQLIMDGDQVVGFQSLSRDITERKKVEEALRQSEEKYRNILESIEEGYYEIDLAGNLTFFNDSLCRIIGYPKEELLGMNFRQYEHKEAIKSVFQKYSEVYQTGEPVALFDRQITRKDGTTRFVETSILLRKDPSGTPIGFRGIARDITERKQMEQQLDHLATHDILTGLPNRLMFSQQLSQAVRSAQRNKRQLAVLFIDLDRFKMINDCLGHEAGDQLLIEIAGRFRKLLRAVDVVARLGGDEFIIFIEEVKEFGQAAVVAHKIISSASKPVFIMGEECRVTASIGISIYPRDGEDEQTLIKNADIAMYFAKEEGKNNYQFYSKDIQALSTERLSIETNLRHALKRKEFSLHYQAKVDFKTGRITGVEALLRWDNANLGSVTPMQFIPVAEETGLIVPIGWWVLKTACAQNVAWQQKGLPPVCVSVNLSLRQLMDDKLLENIEIALNESGMAPNLLELEITESMLIYNPSSLIEVLTNIKKMGVRLAIDNFGTGYASLAQIKNFPIDTIKVDRSFIHNLPKGSGNRSITEAIIAMGKTLSLTVVAEGVETQDQWDYLRNHVCDEMQGFYFSKPVTPDQFGDLLLTHNNLL
jgi:diguanylate cyclase (GGDEF)-like protein/PAS domain S-box-containing protein